MKCPMCGTIGLPSMPEGVVAALVKRRALGFDIWQVWERSGKYANYTTKAEAIEAIESIAENNRVKP